MSQLLTRVVIGLGAAAALFAPVCASAQPNALAGSSADQRCQSVSELSDGSWWIRRPVTFGPAVRIESGSTVYKGEVIGGVDVGAILQRHCRDTTRNWITDPVQFERAF
jgi:hypothetical protein